MKVESTKDKEFDLNMNSWGPYNKEYLGVCHVADRKRGATFNVELFPGFFRRNVLAPYAISDMGVKMWGANASLTRFTYRYELEWKDRVYCDADFVITDDKRCDITCNFVNNTELPQSVNMNLCASLQYPLLKNGGEKIGFRVPYEAIVPQGCRFVDAVDYDCINCGEDIASDGRYLGEEYVKDATGYSTAIDARHFYSDSHFVKYNLQKREKTVLIRWFAIEDTEAEIIACGERLRVSVPASSTFSTTAISFSRPHSDDSALEIRPLGKGITIDSLVFGDEAERTEFIRGEYCVEAERVVCENEMTLAYKGISQRYVIRWNEPVQMVRRYYCNDISRALNLKIHDHVSEVLHSPDSFCVYENLFTEPVFLEPGETKSVSFTVMSGECVPTEAPELYSVISNSDGERYAFSQNMMTYNSFLNVVYPIYTRRRYIRHNTPGRQWDSLYSWDSGFIGMGLATADFERAFDCLNTYLVPVGDMHSPYVLHGSVVPTQIFLYQYLFDRYPEKRDRLKALYPMVKQLYEFYANMDLRSDQMKSGLLKTWDIFYNSGGWDDYPPQVYLHSEKNDSADAGTHNTSPVITSAITVLIAKILSHIAEELGFDDSEDYRKTVEKYSYALLTHAWNEKTGYFSYVVHDGNGYPREFLKYKDGTDYNCGFDGIYPYVADVTDAEMNARIVSNVKNGLMTESGVGVVDKRAPYYRTDGYWNGSVWMPHQWILWRSLLDHGEGTLAFEIANTALNVWKREVGETYCCFENFMSTNGRGSGFHQFSGLSTPVLMFFESYYKPGTVTLGFQSDVISEKWNEEKSELILECVSRGKAPLALICMREGKKYRFLSDGKELDSKKVTAGAYEVRIPYGRCEISVKEG